jgi:hypothetical protein
MEQHLWLLKQRVVAPGVAHDRNTTEIALDFSPGYPHC